MSINNDHEKAPNSAGSVKEPKQTNKKDRFCVKNPEILQICEEADKAGFGLSYGKYVAKHGL